MPERDDDRMRERMPDQRDARDEARTIDRLPERRLPDRAEEFRQLIDRHLHESSRTVAEQDRIWGDFAEPKDANKQLEARERLLAELISKHVFSEERYRDVLGEERCRLIEQMGERPDWHHLEVSDRVLVCQYGEQLAAHLEGRRAQQVDPYVGLADARYTPDWSRIELDHENVLQWGERNEAMKSFFHEQTHAFQWAVVQHPAAFPEISEAQRKEWHANFWNYRKGSETTEQQFIEYENQPLERHANERSTAMLERVNHYERRTGAQVAIAATVDGRATDR